MRPERVTRETPGELHRALVALWGRVAEEAVRDRGAFTAALPGGGTPEGFYRLLAREPGLPWRRTHLFQTDERIVPPDSPRSNARLLRAALIEALPDHPGSLHLIPPGAAAPSARAYEADLRAFFATAGAVVPVFDLVLLGVGEDGHTASLFPGSAALAERERLAVPVPAAAGREPRVTLTLPVIDRARCVVFLATGAAKRAVVARLLAGGDDPGLPASRVAPRQGALLLFADRAAAPVSGVAPR